MKKQEFLSELAGKLTGLLPEDIDRSLEYYSEMVDDRMEEGLSEEEAVAAMGTIQECVAQIRATLPAPALRAANAAAANAAAANAAFMAAPGGQSGKGEVSPSDETPKGEEPRRHLKGGQILLLVICSPLLLALAIVILSLYVVLWSFVVAAFSMELGFAVGALSGIFSSFALLYMGQIPQALLMLGVGLVLAGLSILLVFGIGKLTRGVIFLCKLGVRGLKRCFTGKETVE